MRRGMIVAILVLTAGTSAVFGDTINDLVFMHHSSGQNWLDNSLNTALLAKGYIDARNDIYYGTVMSPDANRPASLGSVPGDNTNMDHWILWFNDYLLGIKTHGCTNGFNRIIMFKSCFPISDIQSEGTEPGDPFAASNQTLANYRAVYRHPSGPGNTYSRNGYIYRPLEDIFAANPDILFIPVTAPPLCYGCTSNENGHRARVFNNWLKNDWLTSYRQTHPGLNNVAVFDWFNVLAYEDTNALHPNRLKGEYGGATSDSHPNSAGNSYSTIVFASGADNFLDTAWGLYTGDYDGDAAVTLPDTWEFATYWLAEPCQANDWCGGRDMDSSGVVDFEDWAIFAHHWRINW
jgi:hypothetical protein